MGLVLSVTLAYVGFTRSNEGMRAGERTTFLRQRVESPRAATGPARFQSLHSFQARLDQV
jgi:hypothetical protein